MRISKLVTTFFILFMTHSAGGIVEITIEQGIENPIPIAVIPFSSAADTSLPVSLEEIIVSDLERSARFKAIEYQDLPQRPTQLEEVNFQDWGLLGVDALVLGKLVQVGGGNYEIEFRLINIFDKKQIVGLQLSAHESQLRVVAHEISDIIYEKLVGVRGAFTTQIAYITVNKKSDGKKNYVLQISDSDGYGPRVLLESPQPLMSPDWSPDGKRLAYVSFEDKSSTIFVQDIGTGERRRVAANKGINSAPAWSPDGSRLAMTLSKDGNAEIYIMDVNSGELQRITNNNAIDTEPSWSPDGRKLVFTSDRGGNPQIYQIEIKDGKRPERLTFQRSYNTRPRYSSDGNSIVMVTGEGGAYQIAILDLNSRFISVLTQARLDESPSFAPNDHMIIYTTTNVEGSMLAAVSVDGKIHQRFSLSGSEVREPVWGPFLSKQ